MSLQVQHLIIIRGNSGSGKSTLARMLQLRMGRGTANIGQDHLRRIILRGQNIPDGDNIAFIRDTARYCLGLGYHVIVEGILCEECYGDMLRSLYAEHVGLKHAFYLDVPLDETPKRHEGKPLRAEVEPWMDADWYKPHDVLGLVDEIVLDTSAMT